MKLSLLVVGSLALVALFQNCTAQKTMDSSGTSSSTGTIPFSNADSGFPTGSPSSSSDDSRQVASAEVVCNKRLKVRMPQLKFFDASLARGSELTQFVMTVANAPANLKACTALKSRGHLDCTKDADFVYLKDAWGAASYDGNFQLFRHASNVVGRGFPNAEYISRFRYADANYDVACPEEQVLEFAFTPQELR